MRSQFNSALQNESIDRSSKQKKFCRFKKSGIKYIDYKDPSFLKQFITGKFSSLHELTIGVELDHKIIQVNNKTINLHLWDTAGLERFHAITINYFKN